MIEDADIYNMEGVFYSLGDIPVGLTWFGHARRVVVRQNTGGGIAFQGGLRNPVKLDSDSGSNWTPVPMQAGQQSERSDAGVSL